MAGRRRGGGAGSELLHCVGLGGGEGGPGGGGAGGSGGGSACRIWPSGPVVLQSAARGHGGHLATIISELVCSRRLVQAVQEQEGPLLWCGRPCGGAPCMMPCHSPACAGVREDQALSLHISAGCRRPLLSPSLHPRRIASTSHPWSTTQPVNHVWCSLQGEEAIFYCIPSQSGPHKHVFSIFYHCIRERLTFSGPGTR